MNEAERIIEVNGYSKLVPITWHEDPTRHLLKQKAVNVKSNGDSELNPLALLSRRKARGTALSRQIN